mgnify:CR=1 FL=1
MIQALKTVLPIQERVKAKEKKYICLNIPEDTGYQILADLEKTRFKARTRLLKELLEKKPHAWVKWGVIAGCLLIAAAAILIIVALPLGLIFARILTDKMFRYCT